ncbi:V/A-type H+-transporting ATPase subunit I [Lachnospiraceae bacterium PM6-15]|uniref:V-type ATP synthase subunit I n=1 Tax=Ohessyouella blattaphilus TaxID=2949333 RepID=A0ABT1EJX3_9FIRM|nr:V-type ATP synthase subunit I [Ohessyouella blattaphilus]MCP1110990.1 V-type ATP synthase subunit I [Ohessyouella blattaphilus]MCR8564384.1 V-type ATP synthase subunit I [Ohessyouella blattaphilus]
MAKLQMQRVSICALKRDRKAILEKLQSLGTLEVNVIEDESLTKMDTSPAKQRFDRKVHQTQTALEILNTYVPEKKSMFASLEGRRDVESHDFSQAVFSRKKVVDTAKRVAAVDKEIAEKKATILKMEAQIDSMQPWLSLEVPLDFKGTEKTGMLVGTMDPETTLENIYTYLKEFDDSLEAVEVDIISKDRNATYVSAIALKEILGKVEEALRLNGFTKPANPVNMVPKDYVEQLKVDIQSCEAEIADSKKEMETLAATRREIEMVADYYRMRKDKYEVLGLLPQSERTFFLSGYMPAEEVPKIEKEIASKYQCVVDIEEIKEEEEPPVVLKNGAFASSIEGVVESYGLPGKNDIDPSKITMVFFIIFFGLMLSDAAYGAIVSIVCFILLKKFPKISEGMRKSLRLFMFCGLSTLVWGLLFGGVFGDLVQIVTKTFFDHEIILKPIWFAPLDKPMLLLTLSLLFGVIHMFVGLGIKAYVCIKDKRYLDAFCDVGLWYLMLTGLILMLLPTDIFASISQMTFSFPPVVNTIAKVMAAAGAIGIFLMSGRSSKNPVLRLGLGAYDLYNITGWLSDILSYSRLLALGLATGVVASVINQMGSMAGKSVAGVIIFIFAFVFGHLLNMAINLLGAYVHTSRLQYVEFFGKFYDGDGRPFNPFKTNNEYVDIKED